jgi:4-hydroxy-tetrahydrodipicolinate synthase
MPGRRTDWRGVFAVSATPFTPEGEIDEAAFCALMRTLVEDGVQGIVVAGSTGEWYTMRDHERRRLFELAREQVGGRARLIAGTSAIATRDAVALTRAAGELGYDGAMVLAPPYALPNERELLAHFEAVAGVGLPLMVYNNPGRTQVNLTASVIDRLCAFESVVALKDSSKDLYQLGQTLRTVGDRLAVFCGLEPYLLPMVQRGAVGVVSMSVNIIGRDAVTLFDHLAAGRFAEARPLEAVIDRLYEAFYIGGFGAYVVIKECMNLVGRPAGWPRRPHLPMDDGGRRRLAGILEEIGVLGGGAGDRGGRAAE